MDKKNKINIEWHSIVRDIIFNFWVIILAALIGYMSTYIVAHRIYAAEYTSSATFVVTTKGTSSSTYGSYTTSKEMTKVFTEVFTQPIMQERAAAYIGKPSFDGRISASALANTNIFTVRVTSDSPQNAYSLLHGVVKAYPDVVTSVFENAIVTVIKDPYMPAYASNGPAGLTPQNAVLTFVLVALIAIVSVSILRTTIKDEKSFKDHIDADLITSIVHERKPLSLDMLFKKKKTSLLVYNNPFVSLKFRESFHKIAAKLEYCKRTDGSNAFAISGVGEDEGKSTIASNIALALASRGNKVVLLDMDEKKPALFKIFDVDTSDMSEITDLFSGDISVNDYKFRRYKKSSLFLALSTKPKRNYHAWIENGSVKTILKKLKEKVDYVIIDTAPFVVDSSVTDIAKTADGVVLVVRTDTSRQAAIETCINSFKETGCRLIGCVLNDVYPEFSFFGNSGVDERGYQHSKYGILGKYYNYARYGKYGYGSKYGYGKYGYGKYGYGYGYGKRGYGYGYGYGYGKYGGYGRYGSYGYGYGNYSSYSNYGGYGNYSGSSDYSLYHVYDDPDAGSSTDEGFTLADPSENILSDDQ